MITEIMRHRLSRDPPTRADRRGEVGDGISITA
jgi:hypothetical protein